MPRQDFTPNLEPRQAPGSGVPIRFSRTRPEPDVNVQEGYAKLQGNQLDAARRDYDKALASDPNNVDALLALAAIAQRQGHTGDADRYLQRAIEADPRSPAALAAVLGGNAGGDQQANESRLKSLLATQPESGPLNFALGNLHARQGRWSEAQQAYFNAVAADADNPDYLFNLAVSLDQLRQPKLAAQHYRLALEAAQRHPAAFDRERVKLRLSELQP
jgi:Tfp pilus assembly protein PilF